MNRLFCCISTYFFSSAFNSFTFSANFCSVTATGCGVVKSTPAFFKMFSE